MSIYRALPDAYHLAARHATTAPGFGAACRPAGWNAQASHRIRTIGSARIPETEYQVLPFGSVFALLTIFAYTIIFIGMMKDSFLNRKFKYTYSNASTYLILTNVLVFLATYYSNIRIKNIPLVYWLSLIPGCVNMGWVWQFVTYMFVHGSLSHLFFNMFALLMFGRTIERYLGTREFLLFYFLCGILGGVVNYLFYMLQGVLGVAVMGASGSIYALLFLCAVLFPTARILFFFVIPVKMPIAVFIYIGIEIADQMLGLRGGVAHLIHLSCIAIAWIYVMLRFRLNPIKVWRDNL